MEEARHVGIDIMAEIARYRDARFESLVDAVPLNGSAKVQCAELKAEIMACKDIAQKREEDGLLPDEERVLRRLSDDEADAFENLLRIETALKAEEEEAAVELKEYVRNEKVAQQLLRKEAVEEAQASLESNKSTFESAARNYYKGQGEAWGVTHSNRSFDATEAAARAWLEAEQALCKAQSKRAETLAFLRDEGI